MALKTPLVEKDADAEAIFWEVRVKDQVLGQIPQTVLSHYIRIKIFNQRGVESQSKVDIQYSGREKIDNIKGRTIRADGRVVELGKDAIFDRTLVKTGRITINSRSFVLPAVEPGSIIEYRWTELRLDRLANYVRLKFQRDIPVHLVKYYIRPLDPDDFGFGMRYQPFQASITPFVKEKDGYMSTTMRNVPAFREEPFMPPTAYVEPWVLIYYTYSKDSSSQYWSKIARDQFETDSQILKTHDELRNAASRIIGDADTPEQKLERLYHYCRSSVGRTAEAPGSQKAEQQRRSKSPSETLKRGFGSGRDINVLFAALARAAGFDARFAYLPDRSNVSFEPETFPNTYFLEIVDVVVRLGTRWMFFDPSDRYLPPGMLRWQEEGVPALIPDPEDTIFVMTPVSSHKESVFRRTGAFRLDENGALEGDVEIEYSGQVALDLRHSQVGLSPAERAAALIDGIKELIGSAEITMLQVENPRDLTTPYRYSYRVRVPGYALRTDKRLLLQPAFFQYGSKPRFSSSERIHPVHFPYAWSEQDEITIELPPGYVPDDAEAPSSTMAGDIAQQDVTIDTANNGRMLRYRRSLSFGRNRLIDFSPSSYANLKQVFDALYQSDTHTVLLKSTGGTAR
jgi:transglutaminase-like putative cysteine protease